ncbi:MAG: tetratricopeptide repeat protein [candidate division Zixibacteria bacterium]|nr:tetratricopeptide repeat protein [candidate division Zixibacteria bacterium]
MKRLILFGSVCLSWTYALATEVELSVESLAVLGSQRFVRGETDSAFGYFNQIIREYPDSPAGYFFMAAAYQSIIDSYRADRYKDQFNNYIEIAIRKGEARLRHSQPSAMDLFYSGAAIGYRGIFRAFHGDWWGAFWDGDKAKGIMEEVLKKDSGVYDAYYGLGSYHYWRSVKSRVFWWLPFFGDNRQKGIDYTKMAIERGNFAKIEGKYALMRIYTEEKNWGEVLAWYDSVSAVNPDYPFCLWLVGQALINLGKLDQAQTTFDHLLEKLKSSSYFESAGEMEVRYNLALIDFHRENYLQALSKLDMILAEKNSVRDNEYGQNTLALARKLKEEVQKKLGKK